MQMVNWRKRVLGNLDKTADHTKEVVRELVDLTTNMPRFKKRHNLRGVVPSPVCEEENEYLTLVAFVHDVYKLREGRDHAGRGADFASKLETVDLIRFHDVLGVVNTGEASALFLGDLVNAARSKDSPFDFLRRLLVLTTVDVAAAGFLTQERLESYEYLLGLVQDAGRSSDDRLSELAKNETAERIGRLLQSNDRIRIRISGAEEIKRAVQRHPEADSFRTALASSRFHYGAWVLEPMFWCWLGQAGPKPEDKHKKHPVVVDGRHAPLLDQFLSRLWDVVNGTYSSLIPETKVRIGGRDLRVCDLEKWLSVKYGPTKRFTKWCARNSKPARNRGQ
jgi:hypothetical protein